MLEYATDSKYRSAVAWNPNGRSFIVLNSDEFMKFVVPQFFKQTKFRSFTRQLNMWGFKNISTAGWIHENFVRGNTDALKLIQRVHIRGQAHSKRASVSVEAKSKPSVKRREVQMRNQEDAALSPLSDISSCTSLGEFNHQDLQCVEHSMNLGPPVPDQPASVGVVYQQPTVSPVAVARRKISDPGAALRFDDVLPPPFIQQAVTDTVSIDSLFFLNEIFGLEDTIVRNEGCRCSFCQVDIQDESNLLSSNCSMNEPH